MRRFDMLRACFWLLAIAIGAMLVLMVGTGLTCGYLVVNGAQTIGTCVQVGLVDVIRETWSEILAAVLALLLAARLPPPPDKE